MGFFGFFKKIGSFLKRALHIVEKFVPDEVLEYAVNEATKVRDRSEGNDVKRETVVALVAAKFHIPESLARLAVELAVQMVKREAK